MTLNPRQFPPDGYDWDDEPPNRISEDGNLFHGSRSVLEAGDVLVPGHTIGKSTDDYDAGNLVERSDGSLQKDHVYLADSEDEGHHWASGGSPLKSLRDYTYEVDAPDAVVDMDTPESGGSHYTAPQALITNRIDIPKPRSFAEPVQGTLAPHDWTHQNPRQQGGITYPPGQAHYDFTRRPTNHRVLSHEGGNPNAEDWAQATRYHDIRQEVQASGDTFSVEPEPRPARRPELPGQQKLPGT
jgi:hypothetical protein